jgi:transcriptional regulator with XRE-family HTH domain
VNTKLRAARLRKRWSIEKASEHAGVSWRTYSRWEHGAQLPRLYNLELLCQAFQMAPEDLGFDAGEAGAQENHVPHAHQDTEPGQGKCLGMDELSFFVYAFQSYCEDTANAELWFRFYRHCPNLFQAAAAHMQGEWSEITFTRTVHTVPCLIGEQMSVPHTEEGSRTHE